MAMKTPASIAGHPIHPMLVAVPIGLRIALFHMGINLTVVALYAVNFWLRVQGAQNSTGIWLSVVGIGLLEISGWLGGKMVFEHGVGVDRV